MFTYCEHIPTFLWEYEEDLNLKLESVLLDCESKDVMAMIGALGIIYFAITGPFWNMLHSNIHYLDQYTYNQTMFGKFREWEIDSSVLLQTNTSIFPDLGVKQDDMWDELVCNFSRSELTRKYYRMSCQGSSK